MKEILLSATLLLALAFSGCDNDSKKTDLGTSSIDSMTRQQVDLNVSSGNTEIATLNTTGITYKIVGGVDKDYFKLVGQELSFKAAQAYVANGDNSYKVEISATDDSKQRKGRLLLVTVTVTEGGGVVVIGDQDTTPPVFTTATTLAMTTGGTVTIEATDASTPITYALTAGAGFTLSGAVLKAPDTAGETNVTITATDAATTPNTATQTILVSVTSPTATGVEFSTVTDNRVTWNEANTTCATMAPTGSWTLPTIAEYSANSADLLSQITVDSDSNSSNGTHFTSILWSSTAANANTEKMGWGYYVNPAEDTAQAMTSTYFFTCIKK